jgi:hypothetical protein
MSSKAGKLTLPFYGCGMQAVLVWRLSHDHKTSLRLVHTPNIPWPYKGAHWQHTKMLKDFVYICYGCGMNFTWVWSLSHDLTASLRLAHTPIILKTPTPAQKHNSVRVRGDPYAHPQHSKVLKHFVYICYECGMHYNITWSQPYTPSIIYPKFPDNSGWIIGQLCPSTA